MKKLIVLTGLIISIVLIDSTSVVAQNETEEVARGIFTTEISDREPVDSLESVPAVLEQVYFFSDLRNMSGKTVFHKWYFNDEMSFEMSFDVGGNRWRVWTAQTISDNQMGTWRVDVVADEEVIDSFEISR